MMITLSMLAQLILVMGLMNHSTCAPEARQRNILRIVHNPHKANLHKDDLQLIQPHILTIERLEQLLRKASQIFRPSTLQLMTEARFVQNQEDPYGSFSQHQPVYVPAPQQQMQPPTAHPYNFYLPQYDKDLGENSDAKSHSIAKFLPPPKQHAKETNYYALKPKKLPKKFSADTKQINLKWLNAFERDALADLNGEIPKPLYLANDERNRINFDDSFFAVDMLIPAPNGNQLPKRIIQNTDFLGKSQASNDFAIPLEEADGEDLIAAPALNLPILSHISRTLSRV